MKAKIWNHNQWINITDKKDLKCLFNGILKQCGFGVMEYTEHDFKPIGFSGLWLLEESHFAIHTFPEENLSYIELSSCNKEKFQRFLNEIDSLYLK